MPRILRERACDRFCAYNFRFSPDRAYAMHGAGAMVLVNIMRIPCFGRRITIGRASIVWPEPTEIVRLSRSRKIMRSAASRNFRRYSSRPAPKGRKVKGVRSFSFALVNAPYRNFPDFASSAGMMRTVHIHNDHRSAGMRRRLHDHLQQPCDRPSKTAVEAERLHDYLSRKFELERRCSSGARRRARYQTPAAPFRGNWTRAQKIKKPR